MENVVYWSFNRLLLVKWLVFHGNVSQFPFHSENRTQICWTQRWCYENHVLEILKKLGLGILTWTRGLNHDHEGGSSRARLLHCTTEWLTPAISPNVGNSTSSFLLVGICVRANPFNLTAARLRLSLTWAVPFQFLHQKVLADGTTPWMRTSFVPLQLCAWERNPVSFALLHLRLLSFDPYCF